MTQPGEFERVEALFHEAVALDSQERMRYLDRECAGDDDLREKIERLIDSDENPTFFTRSVSFQSAFDRDFSGLRLGRYTITRVLARGGMSVVFEAIQDEPRRTVALKIVPGSLVSAEAANRFEFEARILGTLRHVGIAPIYEAGVHRDGLCETPYFAMEYVDGVRIDCYWKEHGLDLAQRLSQIIRVCDAVHHAHRMGVIHRDLKASNILIDADGHPKVLDFGIARAIEEDAEPRGERTEAGRIVGTLASMSPEQASGNPRDLDARSDVYSLGVLLYGGVTGSKPYDVENRPIHEALRIIREDVPGPVVGPLDLRVIVAKALEKDKEQRYQSALELAEDLRRFLSDQPISARPKTRAYLVRKFVHRHRSLVLAVSLLIASLLAGLVSTTFLAHRADNEARRAEERERDAEKARAQAQREKDGAEEVLRFMRTALLLPMTEAWRAGASMNEVLDRASRLVDSGLEDRALIKVGLHQLLGQLFFANQRLNDAGTEFSQALRVSAEVEGRLKTATVCATFGLTAVSMVRSSDDVSSETRDFFQSAVEETTYLSRNDVLEVLNVMLGLSKSLADYGCPEAERFFGREALKLALDVLSTDDPAILELFPRVDPTQDD